MMIWRNPESTSQALRPETKLLLCCARPRLDAQRAYELAALTTGPLDWAHVLAQAGSHGIAPLVFRHLHEIRPPGVPQFALDGLRLAFEHTTRRNLTLLKELFSLLDLLKAHQIPAVPYKGPLLSQLLYGHPGLRPSRDLDIFIPRRDVDHATELLREQHYLALHSFADNDLEHECERALWRADGRIVELHWTITPRYCAVRFDPEEIWRNLVTESVQGRLVPALPPEVLLPLLCVHGSRHLWGRLQWVSDVSILVERMSNWTPAFQLAERMGGRRMLLLGMALVRDLLGTPLTAEARRAVRSDAAVVGLVRSVREQMDRGDGECPDFLQMHRFALTALEHSADRIRYLARHAARPSPFDREHVRLPDRLAFLYIGVKAIRCGIRAASGIAAARRRAAAPK